MRREILTVLRNGDILNVSDTANEYIQYNTIWVLGSSDDAVQFNLNGVSITLPGGTQSVFAIQSLQVTNVYPVAGGPGAANCGLLVQGYGQQKTLFGSGY